MPEGFVDDIRFYFLRGMIINAISGPRNISTALMYAFAQHSRVKVVDEPFYACYLLKTGIDHPGREEIIASMESDPQKVVEQLLDLEKSHDVVFVKNMAHHHLDMDWSYLIDMKNVFLIRDPKFIINSYAQVMREPSLHGIGLKEECDLLRYVDDYGSNVPIVIDSSDIAKHPERQLNELCLKLNIPFESSMLKWSRGKISEDGVWAKYWYENVHNSTGFSEHEPVEVVLPPKYHDLLLAALPYYEELRARIQFIEY